MAAVNYNATLLITVAIFVGISIIGLLCYFLLRKREDKAHFEYTNTIQNYIAAQSQLQAQQINSIQQTITQHLQLSIQNVITHQESSLNRLYDQLNAMVKLNDNKLESIRKSVEDNLYRIRIDSNEKLEQIKLTVEEKLQSTLEKRLGESFSLVSERLEMVYRSLGEMQTLAAGVGDLKKVLSNVKVRGTLGEVHLHAILEQLLTPDQYVRNSVIREGVQDRVEFAIKLPGNNRSDSLDSSSRPVLLPIDAKFPLADYQRLVEAQESCNVSETEACMKNLESTIKKSAKLILDKYIHPPFSTDFAIMFLPIEGLYAEVLRNPGLVEEVQQKYRVIITGPTTFSAILSSLQMGFRTLAIEKRSSDVWKLLEIVQREFLRFGELLSKTRLKLEQATQNILDAEKRSNSLQNKLKRIDVSAARVELLPNSMELPNIAQE